MTENLILLNYACFLFLDGMACEELHWRESSAEANYETNCCVVDDTICGYGRMGRGLLRETSFSQSHVWKMIRIDSSLPSSLLYHLPIMRSIYVILCLLSWRPVSVGTWWQCKRWHLISFSFSFLLVIILFSNWVKKAQVRDEPSPTTMCHNNAVGFRRWLIIVWRK